jgi:hypothetical protein
VTLKTDKISTATLAGKLTKIMQPAPSVKELRAIDEKTRSAVEAWALAEIELPGSLSPPRWLKDWMDGHGAELFVEGDAQADQGAEEEAADDVFSRDEDPPESAMDAAIEAGREIFGEHGGTDAGTVGSARELVLSGGGPAGEAVGLNGAIWRVRQAVICTDYLEGEQVVEDRERGFTYKATRDAFEQLRILWAAEGLHVVPVAEDAKLTRFADHKGRAEGSASIRVQWVIQHLPSGEESKPISTSGVGVGGLDEAFQTAKTMARKQMLCDAFGVQIHTGDIDTEARKR